MDIQRVNRDLILLSRGEYRQASWTLDALGFPNFIRVFGAFQLDPRRFNLQDCNLLIPIPSNLYERAGSGKFHFYEFVYVDKSLRIRKWPLGWRAIKRGHPENLHHEDEIPSHSGWQWICVMHPTCKADDNILTLIASIQTFLHNDA